MTRFFVKNPLPSNESEWTFEAKDLASALKTCHQIAPKLSRFTLVNLSSKEEFHYKKIGSNYLPLSHRNNDHYSMEELGLMVSCLGTKPLPRYKHERLAVIDDRDDEVQEWVCDRFLMNYLGKGYSVKKTKTKISLTSDQTNQSGSFSIENGLVHSFIKLANQNELLKAKIDQQSKELTNLKSSIDTLEENLKENLEEQYSLSRENISLKSALTLDTFTPEGPAEKISESERLISAFEGVELKPEITEEKKSDFQEALDKRIAEAYESLGGQEVCILNRDENGGLQEEHQDFIDEITSNFWKLFSSEKKTKKKD
jgi:hypothetical protein